MDFSLHELACLDAVVSEGSFQAAALKLHRTHPAIYAAIGNLEARLGLALLDRSQYRVSLTTEGEAVHRQARNVLRQAQALASLCGQMAQGVETDLRIVVGDLTSTDVVLERLKHFFETWPGTRLHLHFEAIGGPWERLLNQQADLILHHIDKAETRFEWVDLTEVTLVPVAAPGFLGFPVTADLRPEQMQAYVQVIIRDSARQPERDYFVLHAAPSWTVADQHSKKALIVQGMGWGHMPLHLVEAELDDGRLVSLEGEHFKRSTLGIVAARLAGRPAGPVASALWRYLAERGV